jgi:hypothetical protein
MVFKSEMLLIFADGLKFDTHFPGIDDDNGGQINVEFKINYTHWAI